LGTVQAQEVEALFTLSATVAQLEPLLDEKLTRKWSAPPVRLQVMP